MPWIEDDIEHELSHSDIVSIADEIKDRLGIERTSFRGVQSEQVAQKLPQNGTMSCARHHHRAAEPAGLALPGLQQVLLPGGGSRIPRVAIARELEGRGGLGREAGEEETRGTKAEDREDEAKVSPEGQAFSEVNEAG